MKRLLDVVVAAVGLLVLWPLLVVIAIAVRVNLGAPVLFRQTRPGLRAQPFTILKFRTMRDAKDASGQPLPDAQRLTRFGEFLRRSSLDELPELWNVLVGEMSLVGPRPLLMEYLPLYSAEQAQRHQVRPGITGWAQINGRNELAWQDRLALDVWYVRNRTVRLDLRILWSTIAKVARREGISQPGQATAERFQGNER